jgi:hypothetical protein
MGAAVIAEYPEWGRTNQYFRWLLGCCSPAITRLVLGSRLPANNRPITGIAFSQYSICKGLPCGKGLATHRRVDGIDDTQPVDIRNASNGDRIAQILNLALRVGKRRPRRKTLVVRIA